MSCQNTAATFFEDVFFDITLSSYRVTGDTCMYVFYCAVSEEGGGCLNRSQEASLQPQCGWTSHMIINSPLIYLLHHSEYFHLNR